MKAKKFKRSPCPIACTLDLIGDKWTLLIVRDLLIGKQFYNDFCRSPEKIATNILADRLDKLSQARLIEKFAVSEPSARDAYRLTAKGRSLAPLIEMLTQWGLANIPGTEAKLKPK